jgi:hypothetical protein
MLDAVLGRILTRLLDAVASRIGARGKVLDIAAFCIGLGAVVLIARHFVWVGLAVFLAARLLAAVATHAAGDDAAEVFAVVAFAALPFAFALDAPVRALPAIFLLFGMIANAAARLKFGPSPIGAAELFGAFLLAALLPDWFGLIAYVTGVLCFVAAGVRIAASRRV